MANDTWERIGGVSSDFFGSSFGAGSVSAITSDGTHVFFAGSFTVNLNGTDVPGVIQYTPGTNTWQALGQGIDENGPVNTLATYDGKLYAGSGDMSSGPFFEAGSIALSKIGVFNYNAVDRASEEWVSFGDVLDNSVNQLRVYNGKLFAVGNFSSVDGNAEKGIAMYDFETPGWSGFGGGLVSFGFGAGESIGFAGGQLYASGGFDTAGGVGATRIARWTADFGADESGGGGDGGGGGPVTFSLTAPGDVTSSVSVNPLFTWEAPVGVDVDYYTLEIYDNADLTGFPYFLNFDAITTTSYQYGDSFADLPLLGATTYYWQVNAYENPDVLVAESEYPFSFTTESLELVQPTLVAPADNDEDVSLTPTFTWSKDALAESYLLEYSEGATLSGTPTQVNLTLAQLTDANPNYSYTLSGGSELEANTQYSWRVTAKKTGEDDKPSAVANFTTIDLSPGAFTWNFDPLEFIVSGDINSFNTSWTQSEGATSYELNFKIGDQSFNVFDDPIIVNAPETSYAVDNTKLVNGFTYTVELTAVNEHGRTSTDPLTIIYTPTKPEAVSPSAGASVGAITPFEWESTENFGLLPGNVLVQILYANDESADPVNDPADGIQFDFAGTTDVSESKTLAELFATHESVDIDDFLADNVGQTLYWRVSNKSVRLADDDAESQREVFWSDLESFKIPGPPPGDFSLSTPANGATVETFLPTFTWQQSANATSYIFQISKTTNFDTPLFESEALGRGSDENTVTYTLPDNEVLEIISQYYWRVIASNDGDVDETSSTSGFKTYFNREFVIESPTDEGIYSSVDEARSINYSWSHIFADSDEFFNYSYFFIDDIRVFSNPYETISEGKVFGYNPGGLRSGFNYTWYVEGYADYGDLSTGTIRSTDRTFTINPETPSVSAPVANATLTSSTAFSWSADETIYSMDEGTIGGKFEIQLLFENDVNADPITNPDDGFHFEVFGSINDVDESITLNGLVDSNDDVTLDDILGLEGQTYYWRVRIHPEYTQLDQDRVTLWSDLRAVQVPGPPSAFTLISPDDEAVFTTKQALDDQVFGWYPANMANTYGIEYFFDNHTVYSTANTLENTTTSFSGAELDYFNHGYTYSWRVQAFNEDGSTFSNTHTFTLAPDAAPVLTSPVSGGSVSGATKFEWTGNPSIYDAGTSERITGNFKIQVLFENNPDVDLSENPSQGYEAIVPQEATTINEFSKTLSELFTEEEVQDILFRTGETLFWRVKVDPVYDGVTQERVTLWSDLESFIIPGPPQAFDLLTPANPSADISVTPTFTWEQSQNAESYV
ncbi:MAG TPA: hypothetical protein DCE78_11445, partial [Bacteroidetes bacterium]|nr:hypothetical protein [Bacteroidota bacterium]